MARRTYRLPTRDEAGDELVAAPPRDDDGEEYRRVLGVAPGLDAVPIGYLWAAKDDDPEMWEWVWRHRHPASAAVHDGVAQLEAAIVPVDEDDERYTDE